MPLTVDQRLRIQFRKSIAKGYAPGVELDPSPTPRLAQVREPGETYIVKIPTAGRVYWLSNRRILAETQTESQELVRYNDVRRVHWMFSDLRERWVHAANHGDPVTDIKMAYYDRIEIETTEETAVLEGLGQAYSPALSFLQSLTR